ncbi:tyrosine-type recombinase/integrase [Nesterenkonia sp. E16_7]|nr:tyrosine-type recombinase/integrase [Nesterenkonia sp. E16_10]MBO0597536.1 tyrosine-type recombinase/integrase [Nesterenkonia sp. E16_7]
MHEGAPKTRQSRRTLEIDAETMRHVWPLIRAAGHGNYAFPAGTTKATPRLRQNMIEGAQTRAAKAGFSKRFGLHTFRHSHAAHMLALGLPIHELQWRFGHSSIQVTIDRYGRLTAQRRGTASRLCADGTRALSAAHPVAQLERA